MSKDCSVHRALVDEINCFSCKIVQSIQIYRLFIDDDLFFGCLHIHNCLKQDSVSILNELSHRVQISCQIYRCREDSFLVFSFALSVKLFPPLRYIVKAWLIVCQNFDRLSFSKQNVTDRSILKCSVLCEIILQSFFSSCCCTFHEFLDISTTYCDRKQTNCCQYRETSSYIIRYYKCLVSLFCCKVLQCTFCFVSCCINSLCCFFFSVFLFQNLFKYTEGNGRLSCCSGFRDHVDREISVSHYIDQMFDICTADAVSYIVDLRRFSDLFGYHICERMSQKFNGSSRSEIRSTDSDHKKYF